MYNERLKELEEKRDLQLKLFGKVESNLEIEIDEICLNPMDYIKNLPQDKKNNLRKIAEELNAFGIKTITGKEFTTSTVYQLFKREGLVYDYKTKAHSKYKRDLNRGIKLIENAIKNYKNIHNV